ncbi:MAG: hypothetical protein LBQ81_13640 [Zoogloeaceae bacterium]|jgi:hypothetical protein|nr:hypothetical protein [Zoogloeaceae bacterium]
MKHGFALFVFVFSLMLAGCSSIGMMVVSKKVNKEYFARLASDPDLAIIRGKSGISFEGCPVDISDHHYPTEDERVAIEKFGRLMNEYYDKLMQENMYYAKSMSDHDFLQRNKEQMDSHLQSVLALHEGKLTWAQFGQVCEQIVAERMMKGQQYWEALEAQREQDEYDNWPDEWHEHSDHMKREEAARWRSQERRRKEQEARDRQQEKQRKDADRAQEEEPRRQAILRSPKQQEQQRKDADRAKEEAPQRQGILRSPEQQEQQRKDVDRAKEEAPRRQDILRSPK